MISDAYYCRKATQSGRIVVLTTGEYAVGEYDQKTGDMKWHRVVNATQRESIHNWLRNHYPVTA